MTNLDSLAQAIIEGDPARARELVQVALEEGVEPLAILHGGLIPGMDVVGVRFKARGAFVPEVLVAGQAMQAALEGQGPTAPAPDAALPVPFRLAVSDQG